MILSVTLLLTETSLKEETVSPLSASVASMPYVRIKLPSSRVSALFEIE